MFDFIKKNSYLADTLILTIGTSIAQLIPLIFYPVLSRLFSPEDFGLLATLTSITGIIGVIASGKYEMVILIANSKRNAANVVGLALGIAFIFLSIVFLVFLIFSDQIAGFFNNPDLASLIIICPFLSFLICIYQCYNEWCVRNKYFVNLSLNKITNTSATTFPKILFSALNFNNGLIWGDVTGRFISAIACMYHALRVDRRFFLNLSFKRMKALAIRYKNCPFYIMPGQLLNTFGVELPVFLFALFFASTEIGYYSMSLMILSLPASVISLAVRDVFRKKANDEYLRNGNCIQIYSKTMLILSCLSLIFFFIFFIVAPSLFSIVLGKEWMLAGKYARILCPMIAINFVSDVGFSMFIIAEKMKEAMRWQWCYLFLSVVSIAIGIISFGSIQAVLFCLMIGRSLAYGISIRMSYQFAKGNIIKCE